MTDDALQSRFFRVFPDPVVCYEMESDTPVVQGVNPAFERTFGEDPTTVAGDELADHFADHLAADGIEDLMARLEDGERVSVEIRRGTDGDPRHFRLQAVPPADDAPGYVVWTEITELRRRERDLEARADRLERFIGVAAHDLRNPLEVAKIRLEAARDTGEAVHFEKLAGALERIQHIVREVLSVGGATVEPTAGVSLESVAEAAWSTVDTGSAALTLEDDLPTVEADADLLQQAFENLFRNAVEHAGPDVTVTVGTRSDGFYVADDGPGVPAEERERVFEPGYSNADDTTGLGLAIVRQIADEHGWTVSLETGGDGGARFAFGGVETGKSG